MKSKRKFLSIFAILFALVFALSVCFFAACGNKDDDEKGSDTTTEQGDGTSGGTTEDEESQGGTTVTHEHNYVVDDSTWTFSEDYSACTATAKCTATEGTCDAQTITVEAVVTPNPVSATCTTAGTVTYVATYGEDTVKTSDAIVTDAALGHDVTATWDGTTSSWVYTCSRGDTIAESDAIASIKYMAGSADALESAFENGGTVTLLSDIDGTFTVSADTKLDLAGHSISDTTVTPVAETGSTLDTITVGEDTSLTITDSVGNGKIVNTYTGASSVDNAQAIYSKGTIILDGGTIEAGSVGIRADAGEVVINDGTISAGYTGIWMSRGTVTVTVNGGTIECTQKAIYVGGDGDFGETGTFHPGAVTTLNVYGGEIESSSNSAIVTLGTCNTESAIINIYGGTITSDADAQRSETSEDGNPMPAVYVPSGTLNVSGTADSVPVITGSTAIEIRGGKTTISGGEFNVLEGLQYAQNHAYETSNATTYGYALAVFPYGSGVKNNGQVIDNTVNVEVNGGAFNGDVFGSTESDHTKTTYSWAEYTFEITGGTFSSDPSDYVDTTIYDVTQISNGEWVVTMTYVWALSDYRDTLAASEAPGSYTTYYLHDDKTASQEKLEGDILSYVANSKIEWDTSDRNFSFGGSTFHYGMKTGGNASVDGGRYFSIDLSGLGVGQKVTVSAVYTSNGSNEATLYVGTEFLNTTNAVANSSSNGTTSSATSTAGYVTAEYTVTNSENEALLIWGDINVRFYGIILTIG